MRFHQSPNAYVNRIDLKIENLDRSLAFYEGLIGFKVLSKTENSALLSVDGKSGILFIEQPKNILPKEPRTTGLYHYALLLPNRVELGKVIRHLVEARYPLQGASDHLVSEALYLADPDGNGIEIYSDRPAEIWDWKEDRVEMSTDPLDVEDLLKVSEGKAWQGLHEETIMGHLHLHVSELDKTKQFYCDGLGFEVVATYGNQALFISTGSYHHHIGLNTWNGIGAPAPSSYSVGLSKYYLVIPTNERREQIKIKLEGLGARVDVQGEEYITEDPSGNRVSLITK